MTHTHAFTHFKAAVVRTSGGPFELEEISIQEPRDNEVIVKVVATGMCHTDMVVRDQVYPVPLPIVLGHEGSGVVEKIGKGVSRVSVGDHVVMSFLPCRHCRACQEGAPASCENFNLYNFSGARPDGSHALCDKDDKPLSDRFFGQSSFGVYALAHENNLVKVDKDAPLEILGPLGCGIQTGAGAVLNALKVGAGDSFAAFGGGAVGLSAVMAARVAGATTIIAVDLVESRLTLAKELGATHVINSKTEDAVKRIKEITGNGVDFALDSTGVTPVIRQAVLSLRPRGTCGVVGASKPGANVEIDINDFMQNCKRLRGIVEGDAVADQFIPRLIALHKQGRFPFDKLIKIYPFEKINEAAEDSEKGITLKPIIKIS
jgi:aryl-alcohol dehydrogenase